MIALMTTTITRQHDIVTFPQDTACRQILWSDGQWAAGAAFAAGAAVLAPVGAAAALVGSKTPRQHLLKQHQLLMG